MLLAQLGHQVLLLDRATFPSDTMSTHFIQSPGMMRLAQWGLLDDVLATNCPAVRDAHFDVDGEVAELEIPLEGGLPGLAAPRRYLLDKILVDRAVAEGAELRTGISIDSLVLEDGRVAGVSGHSADGDFEARGKVVVGADGRHSVIAKGTDAPFMKFIEPVSGGYYSYYRGAGIEATTVFFHPGVVCVMFPTNDGLTTVAIAWAPERFPEIRRDIEGNFNAALETFGEIGQRVRNSERAERFSGSADLSNYIRKMTGPGWMLVGDAGYHKDPVAADGISDAFRAAELASQAIDSFLTGGTSEDDAMATYEDRYGEFIGKHFDPAVRCARLDLTPKERMDAFFESRIHDAVEVQAMVAG